MLTIGAYQFPILPFTLPAFKQKMQTIVNDAVKNHVNLLLLPEYFGICLGEPANNDKALFESLQIHVPDFIQLFSNLAKENNLHILAGTLPVKCHTGFKNRAYFFAPNGSVDFQDKINLTQYEKASGLFISDEEIKIFETSIGRIIAPICYDIEFPFLITQAVHLGADIILNPSYTSSLAGHHRIELCCRARAIENQCIVATSPVIGEMSLGNITPEIIRGRSGIFGPADNHFPDNGILALGELDKEMLLTAAVKMENLMRVRQEGQVHNYLDTRNLLNQAKISFPIINLG